VRAGDARRSMFFDDVLRAVLMMNDADVNRIDVLDIIRTRDER